MTNDPERLSCSEVVGSLLAGVPGVRAVCVFGSAASERMREDSDVDVLVVGDLVDLGALGLASLEAGRVLDREIDIKYYASETFRAERERPGTSYLKRVLAGPTMWLLGSPDGALTA
ncbi:MAG TPA: nucleotidyltransferase domain-containing protein [Longimicrobiaceae bacterium]